MRTLAALPALLACSQSLAAIVATTGAVQEITPPADIRAGAAESDTTMILFAERQNVTLAQSLALDITQPGTALADGDITPGTVPAGATVNSYLAHADSVGTPGTPRVFSGSMTFDQDILGLIMTTPRLDASHGVTGLPSVIYPTGSVQGVELSEQGGFITLSADRRTVSFELRVSTGTDNIRVVTVPEPASALLLAAGCFCLRRRLW